MFGSRKARVKYFFNFLFDSLSVQTLSFSHVDSILLIAPSRKHDNSVEPKILWKIIFNNLQSLILVVSETNVLWIEKYLKLVHIFESFDLINHVLDVHSVAVFTVLEPRRVNNFELILLFVISTIAHLNGWDFGFGLLGARMESRARFENIFSKNGVGLSTLACTGWSYNNDCCDIFLSCF